MSGRGDDLDSLSESSPMDDPRLFAAVQEYLTSIEKGNRLNRRELIARYPEIAVELADCLDALAFVNSAAGEISSTGQNRLKIRRSTSQSGYGELDLSNSEPLGDFKLLREIGHGGMGTVYEATQLSLGRRVAVKVLPMAAALDERHLERFHNEAQAAARLHHTNIVPVYAVGCERSVHFYAMQLIQGHSLAQIIEELRTLAERGGLVKTIAHANTPDKTHDNSSDGISVEQTLTSLGAAHSVEYCRSAVKLALQVAEALAYAHEAGIVHRDIKPANLLLDSRGKLWVTDFGLAQLNVDTGLTRSGDLVGTLRYMSPEQASGRAVVLDQRTDIYSLGITLYELLTLERALPGRTHNELLYQIANDQPRSMRLIDKTIPKELETIVNKAISKDAIDRYSSAETFAEDLRRFLKDEPILARPPSLLDKSVKWTRRHKSLAAAIFAVLALATLGFSISTFLIATQKAKTEVAYKLELEKESEAREQHLRAEHIGLLARQAVDFFSGIASSEMTEPIFSDVRREMLEESLSYYQNFLDEAGDSKTVNSDLSAARARVTAFLQRYTALDALLLTTQRIRLLDDHSVQQELGVTRDQVEPLLQKASQPIAGQPTDANALSQAKQFGEQADQLQQAAVAAISANRVHRLVEIFLQWRGPAAMLDRSVIDELNLTSAQQVKIRAILSRLRSAHFAPPDRRPRRNSDFGDGPDDGPPGEASLNNGPPDVGPESRPQNGQAGEEPQNGDRPSPPPPPPPPHRNGFNGPPRELVALTTQAMQQILALLSPQQQATWSGLLGKPFNVDSIQIPRFDGGPHPNGRGAGRDRFPPGGPEINFDH